MYGLMFILGIIFIVCIVLWVREVMKARDRQINKIVEKRLNEREENDKEHNA